MKVKAYFFFSLLVSALISFQACNRGEDDPIIPIAGKGGNATLRVTPMHHVTYIDSCKVYIKYNATEAPVSFDDSAWCTAVGGKPIASFSQLKTGNYYLVARGWDTTIMEAVKGGVPYVITEEKIIDINLPVTEDH
jgi:hypothetical protein